MPSIGMQMARSANYYACFDSAPLENVANPVLSLTQEERVFTDEQLLGLDSWAGGVDGGAITLKCVDLIAVYDTDASSIVPEAVNAGRIAQGGTVHALVFEVSAELLEARDILGEKDNPAMPYFPHCIIIPQIGYSYAQRVFINSIAHMMVGESFTFHLPKVYGTKIYATDIGSALRALRA